MGNDTALAQISQDPDSCRSRQFFDAVLVAILLLAAGLRLIGLGRPLVGNFATKHVVYAMIARNWAEGRSSLWYPTLDVLVGGQRSYHMLEWPASAYLSGALWRMLGGSLEMWGQVTSVVFSVAAAGILYAFVRRRHGRPAAAAAALGLTLSPVSIIYGQSFMLEASLVFFFIAAIDAWDRYLRRPSGPVLAVAFTTLALLLLTKIYMIVFVLPLAWWCWKSKVRPARRWAAAMALLLSIVPAAAWYAHAYRTAEPGTETGGHIFYSVRKSAEEHRPPHPLLGTLGFYRRLLLDLGTVVLTPVGLGLLVLGFWNRDWRAYGPWLAACAILVLLLPRKFYEMNYYDLALLPPLCILVGLGWKQLSGWLGPLRIGQFVVIGLAGALALRYAWGPIKRVSADDRAVVAAGRMVRSITTSEEPVVTMHGTTIDLLYYCHRPGWILSLDTPNLPDELAACRRQGARYVVVVDAATERCDSLLRLRPLVLREHCRIYELPR